MPEDLKLLKNCKTKFKRNPRKNYQKSSFGKAFQLSTELVSAVLVATIIGFILDNWFGTKPWLIIIFFIGVATGIINVVRSAKKMQKDQINMAVNPMTNSTFTELGQKSELEK